jgi:hypothetical protein
VTYTPAPSAYSSTPAQWADDWLTPDEARALRATESLAKLRPAHSAPATRNPLSGRPVPRQSTLSQIIQRTCQTIAYSAIGLSIVGLWYIASMISWALSAH